MIFDSARIWISGEKTYVVMYDDQILNELGKNLG